MVFEIRLTACDTADSLILNCSPKNMSVTRYTAHTRKFKLFNFQDMTPLFGTSSLVILTSAARSVMNEEASNTIVIVSVFSCMIFMAVLLF